MTPHCRFARVFSLPFPSAAQLSIFVRATDELRLYRLNNAFGGCGYGISPKGARKFMQAAFPLDNRLVFDPVLEKHTWEGHIRLFDEGHGDELLFQPIFVLRFAFLRLSSHQMTSSNRRLYDSVVQPGIFAWPQDKSRQLEVASQHKSQFLAARAKLITKLQTSFVMAKLTS